MDPKYAEMTLSNPMNIYLFMTTSTTLKTSRAQHLLLFKKKAIAPSQKLNTMQPTSQLGSEGKIMTNESRQQLLLLQHHHHNNPSKKTITLKTISRLMIYGTTSMMTRAERNRLVLVILIEL